MGYSAIVLDEASKERLLAGLRSQIPDWEIVAHHMTLCMGNLFSFKRDGVNDFSSLKGKQVMFCVNKLGKNDKAMAVQLLDQPNPLIPNGEASLIKEAMAHFGSVPKGPKFFHITVAIDRKNGAKPVDSNTIDHFEEMAPITLSGEILEVA